MDDPTANGNGEPKRCTAVRADGEPCRGWAVRGHPTCIAHNPELADVAQAARRKGGRNANHRLAHLPATGPDLPLATLDDVVAALGCLFNETRKGLVDPKLSNALSIIGQTIIKAIEARDTSRLQQQLERLETLERLATGRISVLQPPLPQIANGGV
jgi:hypothetical protein